MFRSNTKKARTAVVVIAAALITSLLPGIGIVAHGQSGPTSCQTTASTPIPQPSREQLEAAGLADLVLAPETSRRDLVAAPFSKPTDVTNPLFPISNLHSAILNGHVDGKPFYTETTLLPFTRIIEWTPGQCVRVLVSQYMAFLDGRLQETAIDLYAQADDGSVWYLGEDVFDYDAAGRIVTTEGTWHAGTEGPAAMIMPSDPQVGDTNRPENIPGNVFEEVVITAVDQAFDGPSGRVTGGIVGTETHQDGSLSDKLFAPGYGEFLSTDGPDVEAMALASPTDSLPGDPPDDLLELSRGADQIFALQPNENRDWGRAETIAARIAEAWDRLRTTDLPPRLIGPTHKTVKALVDAIDARDRSSIRHASIDVAYAGINLQMRYRPVTEIDALRFGLWARRALADALDRSRGGVRSDVVTLEWIRDRIARSVDAVTLTQIDRLVGALGVDVFDNDLEAALTDARALMRVAGAIN